MSSLQGALRAPGVTQAPECAASGVLGLTQGWRGAHTVTSAAWVRVSGSIRVQRGAYPSHLSAEPLPLHSQ